LETQRQEYVISGLGKKLVEYYTVAKENMQNNCKKEQEIQTPGLAY